MSIIVAFYDVTALPVEGKSSISGAHRDPPISNLTASCVVGQLAPLSDRDNSQIFPMLNVSPSCVVVQLLLLSGRDSNKCGH